MQIITIEEVTGFGSIRISVQVHRVGNYSYAMRLNPRPAHQKLACEPAYGDNQIYVLDTPRTKAWLRLPRFDPVGFENQRAADQLSDYSGGRQQVYVTA